MMSFWKALTNRRQRENIYNRPDFWDTKAMNFSGKAVSMWPNNHLNELYHQEQLNALNALLPEVTNRKVLDVGCGTGRISRYLASRGAQVVGFDFSAKTIAIARQESPGTNPEFRVQSVFELEDQALYDIILSWGVITVACRNRQELANALHRLACALKPDGTLLLLEPIHKGFLHRVLDMDLDEFIDVMKTVGFRIETVKPLHFWPMRLALAFVPWPRSVTSLAYRFGQWTMRVICRDRALGDYRAIRARSAGSPEEPNR